MTPATCGWSDAATEVRGPFVVGGTVAVISPWDDIPLDKAPKVFESE
jgi:hypothetical protein